MNSLWTQISTTTWQCRTTYGQARIEPHAWEARWSASVLTATTFLTASLPNREEAERWCIDQLDPHREQLLSQEYGMR